MTDDEKRAAINDQIAKMSPAQQVAAMLELIEAADADELCGQLGHLLTPAWKNGDQRLRRALMRSIVLRLSQKVLEPNFVEGGT